MLRNSVLDSREIGPQVLGFKPWFLDEIALRGFVTKIQSNYEVQGSEDYCNFLPKQEVVTLKPSFWI